MEEKENYTGDKPVSQKNEDRFQRYPFSKRIAETIINRNSKECIVFGLYGAWGEGKSSVLNFICQELQNLDTIIVTNFNPWRYNDEETLLKNFFYHIAKALGKDIDKWYEKLFGFIGKAGSNFKYKDIGVEGIAKMISTVGLETFKKRVDQFLNDSKNKLVVIIDDIDRLNKKEISTLFRLVKLTADFSNTTYILSFDNMMVAAAIGEQFGEGNTKAGEGFLEKIIQVPLNLPKAQPAALQNFCFELVEKAFEVNSMEIDGEEWQEYVDQFSSYLMPKVNTPRLAVRYGNLLSFSLPLLKGEIYTTDLMLIEGFKVLYPKHYHFIKDNPDYFIGSYHLYENTKDEDKIARFKKQFDELNKELGDTEKSSLSDLLTFLFPTLSTRHENNELSDKTRTKLYNNKRIASSYYFDRYFSYAVIEGDISDVEFDALINNAANKSVVEMESAMRKMIEKTDAGNFIFKLRSKETLLGWEDGKMIARAISQITDVLPHKEGSLWFGYESTRAQASLFIYHLIKNNRAQNILEFAKELMTLPTDSNFSYAINNWLRSGKDENDQLFTYEQYQEIAQEFRKRVFEQLGEQSVFDIFENFPDKLHYIIYTWVEQDEKAFQTYAEEYLNKNKNNVINFMRSIIPMGKSNAREGEYKSDLTQDVYKYLTSLIDKEELMRRITEVFQLEEINKERPYMIDFGVNEFTDLNMVRQFYRWYAIENKSDQIIQSAE